MGALELVAGLPAFAKDARLNLQSVLGASTLTDAQKWGAAVTAAATARQPALLRALVADARGAVGDAVVDDALAAASLMAMNNVFYRFRHMVHKPAYGERPPRLRMNRMANPATIRLDFELFCLVASAQNGCELCVGSHEAVVTSGGLTVDQVADAVRIAAVVQAAAVSLELADVGSPA